MMRTISCVTTSLFLLAGCGLKVGELGDLTITDGSTSGTASASGASTGDEAPTTGAADTTDSPDTDGELAAQGVDILFVIDNSGSMAGHQQRIASAIPALVGPLTAAGLDLRIGVTTTDASNPRCPNATSTPEGGRLQTRSCRAAAAEGEWTFNDVDFSASCLEVCQHDSVVITPTTTAGDPVAKSRPWIEWHDGAGNVDVPLGEALACLLPQGVAGCGFESPLESMFLALEAATVAGQAQFGFLRDDAHLLVVLVTDEMDCSYRAEFKDIFTSNKVFWNGPDDAAPTSGLCWRAGMACAGGPGTYDNCVATDHASDGAVTQDPGATVLQPLSRYQGILSTILAGKQAAGFGATVRLTAIAGVPGGYPAAPLVFADSPDMAVQESFGIGPGCTAGDAIAVPPGRILDLAAQVNPVGPNLFSICDASFDGSLAAIAAALLEG